MGLCYRNQCCGRFESIYTLLWDSVIEVTAIAGLKVSRLYSVESSRTVVAAYSSLKSGWLF